MYLAIIGAHVSVAGVLHSIVETNAKFKFLQIVFGVLEALVFGAVLTPMVFMFFLHGGNRYILSILDIERIELLNSFWFGASIMVSWHVVPLWRFFLEGIKERFTKRW